MSWWWPFGTPKPSLYGYRLDRWHFLGTTEMSFTNNGEDVAWLRATVAFFLHKRKLLRSFKVVGIADLSHHRRQQIMNHPFYVRAAEQWAAGEHSIQWPVVEPSGYLSNYMREEFGWRWDYTDKRWVLIEAEPEKRPPIRLRKKHASKDNIVVIDFTKPDKP